MSKYKLRFWFEHDGSCIWSMNNEARDLFGYSVNKNALPISKELVNELDTLETEYSTYLDWSCPQKATSWTKEHKEDFVNRAMVTFDKAKLELGDDFELKNEVNLCID